MCDGVSLCVGSDCVVFGVSGLTVFDVVCPAVCHITGKRLKVVGDQ